MLRKKGHGCLSAVRTVGRVLLCCAVMLAAFSGPVTTLGEQVLYGDVNRSGKVDTTDARLILQASVGKIKGSDIPDMTDELFQVLGDVNLDEKVNTTDARMVLQLAVKKIEDLPAGEYYTIKKPKIVYPEEYTPLPNPETFADYTSGNPIFTNIFTADPSAHVWEDGRLYVYPSHDIFPARGCDLMDKYHVYSTDNMVDWVDHGEIFSSDDVPWGRPEGGFMWAPDCAYKDGKYYLFYPHPTGSGDEWNYTWKFGVAVSDTPTGRFKDLGYIEGIGSSRQLPSFIDPCVFQDDDGTYYLYGGGGGRCFGWVLNDDFLSVGDGRRFTELEEDGPGGFHEGAWVFKRNGIYYLMYSDNKPGANCMRYAMSDSPLGPWTKMGVMMDPVKDCETTHGSVVQYRGNWYIFYHNAAISGQGNLRSVCVDRLYFNEDGTIQKVVQTETGVEAVGPPSESTEMSGKNAGKGIPLDEYPNKTEYSLANAEVGNGATKNANNVIENLHLSNSYVELKNINGGTKGGKAVLEVTYAAQGNASLKADTNGQGGYFVKITSTGSWSNYTGKTYCVVDLLPGNENTLRLTGGMGGANISGIAVYLKS